MITELIDHKLQLMRQGEKTMIIQHSSADSPKNVSAFLEGCNEFFLCYLIDLRVVQKTALSPALQAICEKNQQSVNGVKVVKPPRPEKPVKPARLSALFSQKALQEAMACEREGESSEGGELAPTGCVSGELSPVGVQDDVSVCESGKSGSNRASGSGRIAESSGNRASGNDNRASGNGDKPAESNNRSSGNDNRSSGNDNNEENASQPAERSAPRPKPPKPAKPVKPLRKETTPSSDGVVPADSVESPSCSPAVRSPRTLCKSLQVSEDAQLVLRKKKSSELKQPPALPPKPPRGPPQKPPKPHSLIHPHFKPVKPVKPAQFENYHVTKRTVNSPSSDSVTGSSCEE